jgi:hypothetical protein
MRSILNYNHMAAFDASKETDKNYCRAAALRFCGRKRRGRRIRRRNRLAGHNTIRDA